MSCFQRSGFIRLLSLLSLFPVPYCVVGGSMADEAMLPAPPPPAAAAALAALHSSKLLCTARTIARPNLR